MLSTQKQKRADSGSKCTGAGGVYCGDEIIHVFLLKSKPEEKKTPHTSPSPTGTESFLLMENKNMSCQCVKAHKQALQVLQTAKTEGLTQNIILKPKMKYLMQQLTSWALKCFPDIIWMDVCVVAARSGKESHLWSLLCLTAFFFSFF